MFLIMITLVLVSGCSNTDDLSDNAFEIETDNYFTVYLNQGEEGIVEGSTTIYLNEAMFDSFTFDFPADIQEKVSINAVDEVPMDIILHEDWGDITYSATNYVQGLGWLISYLNEERQAEYRKFTVNDVTGYYTEQEDGNGYIVYVDTGIENMQLKIEFTYSNVDAKSEMPIDVFASQYFPITINPLASELVEPEIVENI
jgi:hypothetical protein